MTLTPTLNRKTVKFGDVVHLNTDRIKDPLAEGIERYVGLAHITPEDLRIRSWGLVAEGITFTNHFKPGQVLFGKRRAYQRKIAVADFEGVCSGDIYIFESKDPDKLLPELLPFICQSEGFYEYAVRTSAGSLSPRTNWKHLAEYEFPLPPIDEQRRIAELLWAADDVIESLKKSLEKLLLVDSSMKFAFFTAENDKVNLGELVADNRLSYKTGPFGTVLKASSYVDTGIPVVNPVNMKDGDFFVEDGPFISGQEAERLAVYKIVENDLIFGRKGDIGRGIFSTQKHEGYIVGSDCIRIRVLGDELIPKYLFYFLTSPASKRLLASYAHGTTMPGINEKMLSKMEVHIPDKQEQIEITDKLEEIDKAKSRIMSKIEMSYELKRNLLTNLLMG